MKLNIILAIIAVLTIIQGMPTQAETTFKDISMHWAKGDIQAMSDLGLVKGFEDGTYKPNNTITRAEFVAILTRILGLQGSDNPFSGMPSWANQAVGGAVKAGIIDRSEYATFENKEITRREMAKMIALSLAQNPEYKALLDTFHGLYYMDLPFTEAKTMNPADVPYIGLANGAGIIGGDAEANFHLNDKATRAEATAMLYRLTKAKNKKPSDFFALKELEEVANTGTNMTTISGAFKLHLEKVTGTKVSHTNFDAELKRVYVIPLTGSTKSLFEKKFIWNRNGLTDWWKNPQNVQGVVTYVYKVTFKKQVNVYTGYYINCGISPYTVFTYTKPAEKFGFEDHDTFAKSVTLGESYEIVLRGPYNKNATYGFFGFTSPEVGQNIFYKKPE